MIEKCDNCDKLIDTDKEPSMTWYVDNVNSVRVCMACWDAVAESYGFPKSEKIIGRDQDEEN
jgi:hypothetical protein